MNHRRLAPVAAGMLLAMVGGLTCTDLSSPRTALTQVGLAPRFTRAAEDALRNLASFHLELDNIRVRLNRGDGSTAVDTVVAMTAGAESVSIELTVRVNGSEEQLDAIIELRAGDLVLFSGTQVVIARTTGESSSGPPIEVEYVGPGAGAVDVNVLPGEIAILSNQTAAFTAVAFDATEQLLPNILVDWSVRDPAIGSVSDAGVFTPVAGVRGSTWVIATLPTNVKDSAHVTVFPPPASAVLVSGGEQSGAVNQLLSPFVFEVRAADELPVPGVAVGFSVSSGGGQLSASTGTTDGSGRVSVTLTLGTQPGENAVQLLVGDEVFATATAVAGVGLPAALALEGGSPISVQAGQAIAAVHAVRVFDAFENPVPNVQVRLALTPQGSSEVLLQTTATSDQNGRVLLSALGATQSAGLFDIHATVVEPAGITPVVVPVEVVAGSGSMLAFTTQPPTAQAGAPFTVAVSVRDAQGNVATGFTGPVTIALGNNPTEATLGGTLTRNAVAGVATFDDLAITVASPGYTLSAAGSGLTTVTSVTFNVDPAAVAVLAFIAQPSTVATGGQFALAVAARDAFSNIVTSFTGAVAIAFGNNPTQAVLSGTLTQNAVAGVATFSDLAINLGGTGYTLVATSDALNGTSAAIEAAESHRFVWIAATGGSWGDVANWDRGALPGAADTAVIALNGTYTVTLNQSASVASLEVGGTTGQQRLLISANTLTVSTLGVFTQNSVLELSGGTIDGAGGILLNGQFFWSGGTLQGAGSLQTTPGSLTEIGGSSKSLVQRFVGIGGNGTWQGGDIFTGSSAQFHVLPGGSLTVSANVSFNHNLGGSAPAFVNGGTLTTSGTIVVSGMFNNAGALSVDAGMLTLLGGGSWVSTTTSLADDAIINFGNGSHALGGEIALTGAGEVQVTGGTVSIVGTYSSTGTTRITAGTLAFDPTESATLAQLILSNGTLSGGGTVNVTSQFTWSGGSLSGTGVTNVLSGATATLDGAVKSLSQRTLAIGGTGSWTLGDINSGSVGQLSVLSGGSLTIPGGVQMHHNLGGSPPALSNAGTLTIGGSVAISGAFNNSGTLSVQPGALTLSGGGAWSGTQGVTVANGATVSLTGGTHTLGGPVNVSGTGELHFGGASATVTGTYVAAGITRVTGGTASFASTPAATTAQLVVTGGTIAGTGRLDVTQAFSWSGGALSDLGVTNVNAGATASLEGGVKSLAQRLLQIEGTASWTAGDINSGSGAQLTVATGGSLAVPGGVTMHHNLGGGPPALNNAGTLTTNGAVGVSTMFNNSATVTVESGVLTLSGGGTWSGTQGVTVADGALLSMTGGTHALGGTINVAGTGEMRFGGASATISGTYANSGITRVSNGTAVFITASPATTTQLIVTGGTLSGSGEVHVTGAMSWSGGSMSGTGVTQVNAGASATLDGLVKSISERTLLLLGNGVWNSGDINSGSAGQITIAPSATLSIPTSVMMHYNLGGNLSALNNSGTVTIAGTVVVGAAFNNSGTLTVQSGSLTLLGGGTWSGTQAVTIATGALGFGGGPFTLGGIINATGAGSMLFSGATASITDAFTSNAVTRVTAGSVSFNQAQPATLTQLFVTGGELSGSGAVDVGESFTWSGGTLSGAGATNVLSGATATLDGAVKNLSGRTLAIAGNGTWSSGDLQTGSAAQMQILPTGSLAITGAVALVHNLGGILPRFVIDGGTLQPFADVAMGIALDNRGSLVVEGGTFTSTAGGAWSGTRNVGINLGAMIDLRAGSFSHEGLLTSMGLQSGIGIMRFSGADFVVTGSYRVVGAAEVVNTSRLTISQDFIVDGLLTQAGGQISVTGNTTFAGAQQVLSGGTLLLGGNFSHTGNGDNQRLIGSLPHITRFVGDATDGRTLQWNVPDPVANLSSFGQLEIATTGAGGVSLSSNLAAARFAATHLLVQPQAAFRIPSTPRFVLQLGGTSGFGLIIEAAGILDNPLATIQVTGNSGCGPLTGLLQGRIECLTP